MTKSDPTKDPEFKRVLGNLLKAKPKSQAQMKVGKRRQKMIIGCLPPPGCQWQIVGKWPRGRTEDILREMGQEGFQSSERLSSPKKVKTVPRTSRKKPPAV